ncbi:MAG: DUF4923 family protein [Bacteroidales bacterium]|nr:DUF4923 family protein [Bacteroidales bacterium]
MKKILTILTLALIGCGFNANAQLSDLLNKVKSAASSSSSSSDDSSSSSSSSLGNILSGVLSNVLSTSDIELSDLVGTWNYSAPAVTLESENALQKIGGSAATAVIEEKLEPYYKKAGAEKLVLTVADDYSFTMKLAVGSLSGTIEKEDTQLIFNFKALSKISIGKMEPMASISGSTLTLTFDASQLQKLLTTIASVSGNSTISTVSSLLNSYDGLYAGFKMTKQ